MKTALVSIIAAGVIGFLSPSEALADAKTHVVLQGLDKVTARVSRLEGKVGHFIRFGNLEIVARRCDKRPPEEPPESSAFLEISDVKPGEEPVAVFNGWMFASSPGLNSMEHPVYDIWVLDCKDIAEISEESSSEVGSE